MHCLGERWQWIKLPLTWTPNFMQTKIMGTTGFVMSGAVTFDHRDIHKRRRQFFSLFQRLLSRFYPEFLTKLTLSKLHSHFIWIKFRQILPNFLSPLHWRRILWMAPWPHRSSGNGDLASCNEWQILDPSHGHSDPYGGYHYHGVIKIIIKFIYSEKPTIFCEISTLDLTVTK